MNVLSEERIVADWYYIGHYGQLGPLTREQVDELISGGVIVRETYVWRSGMPSWLMAGEVHELANAFVLSAPLMPPPPPPSVSPGTSVPTSAFSSPPMSSAPSYPIAPAYSQPLIPVHNMMRSDRNKYAAGFLNIVLPGVGRMYLGYAAYGVLQLFITFATCGIGYLWPFIDGILMFTGTVKVDGYGRVLDP